MLLPPIVLLDLPSPMKDRALLQMKVSMNPLISPLCLFLLQIVLLLSLGGLFFTSCLQNQPWIPTSMADGWGRGQSIGAERNSSFNRRFSKGDLSRPSLSVFSSLPVFVLTRTCICKYIITCVCVCKVPQQLQQHHWNSRLSRWNSTLPYFLLASIFRNCEILVPGDTYLNLIFWSTWTIYVYIIT